jgi:phage repressor protein C with HTH and peptisase S24 domain
MGVSPSAFRKWLKGEAEPSRERLVSLANAAGVTIGWLASGEGPEPDFESDEHARSHHAARGPDELARFVRLPRRATTAAAGAVAGPEPDWADTEFIALRHDWVRTAIGVDPAHIGLEIAVGDSMSPTIHDADILLVDMAEREFGQFGIYVVEIGGERIVKRIQRKLDGTIILISDNATYEREYLTPERVAELKVIGRVVWVGGGV